MSVKVCVLFDHRGRAQKDKEGPVEIRITYARKPYYINTGVHVRRDEWLGSVINRSDAKELNERLTAERLTWRRYVSGCIPACQMKRVMLS